MVRINVARSELIFSTPSLAKMAVSAANAAEKTAQNCQDDKALFCMELLSPRMPDSQSAKSACSPLPATPALRREQIKVQVALISPLMHTKGHAAPETKASLDLARSLIERAEALGAPPNSAAEKQSPRHPASGLVPNGIVAPCGNSCLLPLEPRRLFCPAILSGLQVGVFESVVPVTMDGDWRPEVLGLWRDFVLRLSSAPVVSTAHIVRPSVMQIQTERCGSSPACACAGCYCARS